ncbi:MAG: hypothetical protein A2186_01845 [Candidatus Levybacteria bacterium RIFOXYA1_FULL_41_10]|nr:MAG: hypothetical protein A3D82_03210 [Candidatus Levybacteria bacterium RIFCSPHIGHO2_02_FULL_40_29]OGH30758.1 MAG: hypothetical protein A3E70_00590 [Candidatus Levybacteria bacterium RIFCSPHIGHO2_12_FULL_40_44]OGH57250.1 MAG: hypothetical protein A2186_01845 [Candidatus Levybacteria bacterium RIFOXYA1_FULL_41_10]OGH70777.1 MAG: hypothetical protein A2396_01650 [Candidatus Levybacteria bacterium RIFOXYB1_FULL_40_17]HBB76671.1 hypothetical protein [Candidatus Levybacteria bacterium]
MRIVFRLLGIFLIFFFLFLIPSKNSYAAECPIKSTDPAQPIPVETPRNQISITLDANDLSQWQDAEKTVKTQYDIYVDGYPMFPPTDVWFYVEGPEDNQTLTVTKGGFTSYFEATEGDHTVSVKPRGGLEVCRTKFTVASVADIGNLCRSDDIEFVNETFSPQDLITVRVPNLKADPAFSEKSTVAVQQRTDSGWNVNPYRVCNYNVDIVGNGVPVGRFAVGDNYRVAIFRGCDDFFHNETLACSRGFEICEHDSPGCEAGEEGGPVAPPEPVCTLKGNYFECLTAIGPIAATAGAFISRLLLIVLSLAGGIAVLLIIISGYRLMASQGNPEKIQEARDQLTSAIVGLLFIIFSITILQIIGSDILKIPQFGL